MSWQSVHNRRMSSKSVLACDDSLFSGGVTFGLSLSEVETREDSSFGLLSHNSK